jgi:hypothetical protein
LEWKRQNQEALELIKGPSSIYDMYMGQKKRRYVEAKTRVMIDYLLRFDGAFRQMYFKSRSIEKMKQIVDKKQQPWETSREEYLDKIDIFEFRPEDFANDKKSLMLRIIEKGVQRELPENFLEEHPMLVEHEIQTFVEEKIIGITKDLERKLVTDLIEEKRLLRNRKIEELEYINHVKEWIDKNKQGPASEVAEWLKQMTSLSKFD